MFICELCGFQRPAPNLVELHRFEQRAEVALAEALVALPLDDLEEDGPDHGFGEDLEKEPASGSPVQENFAAAQFAERLGVPGKALVEELVIRIGRIEQLNAFRVQRVNGPINVARVQSDVLDPLAM